MTDPSPRDSTSTPEPADLARAVRRKLAIRLLPLIFVLYVVAYLDRANVGFAKLAMKQDLQFSEAAFGWGFGLFFVGYLFLEIPGALIVERRSARKWFARILVTWGACSMATALVRTEWQFYLARFLLGLAEAGFFPGVIVYFTHWFPRRDRARALAGLALGVPFSLALGARVSGWLLEQSWLDLAGWQWVFLLEG
ncbi:MAG TPA: MFS transporter, partial [Gemmataceae bacterium]|nr:MFS transporter [Gemmataceae bacterium]